MSSVKIGKLDSGFSVYSDSNRTSENHATDTFEKAVALAAKLLGITSGKDVEEVVSTQSRRMGKSFLMSKLLDPNAFGEELDKEASYDKVRDELGEQRRLAQRRKEKIDELTSVNARVVKLEQVAVLRLDSVTNERNNLIIENERLGGLLVKAGIDPQTGKKIPVAKPKK